MLDNTTFCAIIVTDLENKEDSTIRFVGDNLELIMIGPHENYYRDLKT